MTQNSGGKPATTSTSAPASSAPAAASAPTSSSAPTSGSKMSAPAPAPAPGVDPSRVHAAPAPLEPAKGPFRGGPAYKAWAPPEKQWEKQAEKKKSDETRIEIQDEWDEEGNLTRTTIKKIVTPDWKIKKETTVEQIPAAEAAKYR